MALVLGTGSKADGCDDTMAGQAPVVPLPVLVSGKGLVVARPASLVVVCTSLVRASSSFTTAGVLDVWNEKDDFMDVETLFLRAVGGVVAGRYVVGGSC